MSQTLTMAAVIFVSLFGAVFGGSLLRRRLPEHHLTPETKDVIKMTTGMVLTMTALLLGLLVASAKGTYDAQRTEIQQLAAKAAFLDRVLAAYGSEAHAVRLLFRRSLARGMDRLWSGQAMEATASRPEGSDVHYEALQALDARTESQRGLKTQALSVAAEMAELHAMIQAQAMPSISMTMLLLVIAWLVIVYASFGLLAPPNATAMISCLVSALAVAGALMLILELDRPFSGMLQLSKQPLINVVGTEGQGGG